MSVKEYKKAIREVFQSGLVDGDIIKKHIEQQMLLEKFLPDSASFFFVVEPATHTYHFIGKQQESVTGYANAEPVRKGMAFFLENLHPEEVDLLLDELYPELFRTLGELAKAEDIRKASAQFNYRFKAKNGEYLNLVEHLWVLETDQEGNPALFLGNIVALANTEALPLRLCIKMMRGHDSMTIILSTTFSTVKSLFTNITVRELEIMRHLAMGMTSKRIGEKLFISHHTVDTHRRNLLKKLDCRSVTELARLAFQNGVL